MGRSGLRWFFVLVLCLVVQAISYLAVGNSCRSIMKDINALEGERHSIEKDLTREQGRWADCTTPTCLEKCLVSHGLDMELAGGEQIVSLRGKTPHGRPAANRGVYASNHRRP